MVADINREIIALWTKQFGSAQGEVYWPMISPAVKQHGLTVVGCNPNLPKSGYYCVPLFTSVTQQQVDSLATCEANARGRDGYRTYYGPLWKLADHLTLTMEHVDLFFYRTNKSTKRVPTADAHFHDWKKTDCFWSTPT